MAGVAEAPGIEWIMVLHSLRQGGARVTSEYLLPFGDGFKSRPHESGGALSHGKSRGARSGWLSPWYTAALSGELGVK